MTIHHGRSSGPPPCAPGPGRAVRTVPMAMRVRHVTPRSECPTGLTADERRTIGQVVAAQLSSNVRIIIISTGTAAGSRYNTGIRDHHYGLIYESGAADGG